MRFLLPFLAVLAFVTPVLADDDRGCQNVAFTINPTEATATNDFVNLQDFGISATETDEDWYVVGRETVVWGLKANTLGVAPGAGDEWAITVRDDGASTAVTCTIADTATSCATSGFTAQTVAADSDLTVLVSSAGGATAPATTSEIRVSFCMDVK